jgi:glycosyltransferase involved in cell wall biosynthesis
MNKNPLVSIIMNCHNGEKYLKDSVKSIINQSYKNWELIFWDNLSKDSSKKIIKKFKDKRIKYFKSKNFLNLYDARNSALKKTKGKFIAFLDTDDWWVKDKIKKQLIVFSEQNEIKLVYSNCYLYNQKNKNKKIFINNRLPEGSITQELLNKYSVGLLTTVVKKEVFKKDIFNHKLNIIGDFEFIIKLSKKAKFGCVQEPLAYYRHHENNFSQKYLDIYIKEVKFWLNKNKKSMEKKGLSLHTQKILLKKLQFKYYFKNIIKSISF